RTARQVRPRPARPGRIASPAPERGRRRRRAPERREPGPPAQAPPERARQEPGPPVPPRPAHRRPATAAVADRAPGDPRTPTTDLPGSPDPRAFGSLPPVQRARSSVPRTEGVTALSGVRAWDAQTNPPRARRSGDTAPGRSVRRSHHAGTARAPRDAA